MTDLGWEIDEDDEVTDWIEEDDQEDDWDDDWQDNQEPQDPDYDCWDCGDTGEVIGLHRDGRKVNCPTCRPTPRQVRRRPLVVAWWARKHDRDIEARVTAGMARWEAEAPF